MCSMMGSEIASVDDWVSEGTVGTIIGDPSTKAPSLAFFRACFHVCETCQRFFDAKIAAPGWSSISAVVVAFA